MIARRELIALGAAAVIAGPASGAHPQPQPRLLAFGDSLTGGFGLAKGEGLVPVLSDWLTAHDRPAHLVDAGLSGDTTYGGRVRIGWSLRSRPDAVIVALGGNDMLMGISPAQAEANLDAILTRAGAGGRPVLLAGIRAPRGTAALRDAWAAIWPRLAARHDAVLWPDLYAPLAARPPAERDHLLLPDGLHPSARGVRLMVEGLGPAVALLLARVGA